MQKGSVPVKGRSYRGVKITTADLRAYRWALKSKAVISTKTFCSTSVDRHVAERFAGASHPHADKQSVLIIFNFSQICNTAIDLRRLSHDLPCLSEYENEAEILVLPLSIFQVKSTEENSGKIVIELENIPMQ
ncbi:unnamed protein product [Didymodactylos carnosus]|uniref:Uncharacterized protein n=2 Tax=Didymodactylos carnosus TaxID=1234261 RepID=A0A8S2F1T3_9BILA|nr:unnamed protein product [Didymodactylos carnosus]CAF4182130.1 unnamed protein product [Didymodactylos carnosus]